MIGSTVSHYKVIEQIGEGGMGLVYRAEDTRLQRDVAMKFLREDFASSDERAAFIREARTAATLNHPNICTVYEIDKSATGVFIAMEFVDGTSLGELVDQGPVEPDVAIELVIQAARGLGAAHAKGTIHRDVKPANIMVTPEGRVVIMDFGLAAGRGAPTDSDTVSGTLPYMSPEQLSGDALDERTDIWSLGVVLYEMLTAQPPFHADYDTAIGYAIINEDPAPVSELRPGLPFGVDLVIERVLAKAPKDRYATMADMCSELETLLATGGGRLSTASPTSVAVLPFSDLSEGGDQEYFCDGIADETIGRLARLQLLRVASRTSSFAFKGESQDVRAIGQKLGVQSVLEGSVRKAGDRVRINAQLISVSDGYHLWSDQYDRDLSDIFAIQEDIAREIVAALEIELSDEQKHAIEKTGTKDVDAYDFYLRGRRFFYQTRRTNLTKARDMFSQAIKKDDLFALAYAGMSDCYSYLYWYFDHSPENLQRAIDASKKALELDPELAEAHAARGLALTLSERYEEAERHYEEAVRLNPTLFEAYYFHGRTRFVQGDMEGAAEKFEKACAVNPDDYLGPMMLGFVQATLHRAEESRATYRRGLNNVEAQLAAYPDDSRALYMASSALIDLKDKERAMRYAMRAVSLDPDDSYILYGIACNFCKLDELEDAAFYFERAVTCGFAHKEWIEHDADLDPIREHPRFKAAIANLE